MKQALKEIKYGFLFWLFGVVGFITVFIYVTKNALVLYVLFGSSFAIGIVLMWCGIFDYFCDEFEDEVKQGYLVD